MEKQIHFVVYTSWHSGIQFEKNGLTVLDQISSSEGLRCRSFSGLILRASPHRFPASIFFLLCQLSDSRLCTVSSASEGCPYHGIQPAPLIPAGDFGNAMLALAGREGGLRHFMEHSREPCGDSAKSTNVVNRRGSRMSSAIGTLSADLH